MNKKIEKWGIYEACFQGPKEGNTFLKVKFTVVFKHERKLVEVDGFYDGDGTYKVSLMPSILGEWTFTTKSNVESLDARSGSLECVEATTNYHGPVMVKEKFHFEYTDGTPHYSFGTTCYAWIN